MKLINDISQYQGWEEVLAASIDKIIVILAICSVPAAIASTSRVTISGFQPSMALHIAICLSLIIAALKRRHLSVKFKLNYLLLLSVAVSVFGIYNWGLIGNGFLWSLLVIVFSTLYYGIKAGFIASIAFCLYCSVIGFLYISGFLDMPIDPESYFTSLSGWATAVIGALFPLCLTVLVVGTLYDTAKSMLLKLEKQRVEITVLAERDSLTGLYNARVFHELIAHAMERSKRHDSWVYLVNIDLDNFKSVNDSYGHHAGDCVLKYISDQLLAATRSEDTLCRVGGDEFLILIEHPKRHSEEQLQQLITRLKEAIEIPYLYEGQTLEIRGSIGIAEYNAESTPDLISKDDILKRGDRNMFKDKRKNRAQQAS